MLDIANATASDVDALAPLFDGYRQFYHQPSDVAAARSFLQERLARGDSVILIARNGAAALGFVQLYPSFSSVSMCPIWILNDLYVAGDVRGRGVAAALLSAAVRHAKRTGAGRLELETGMDNVAAKTLYERMGWTKVAGCDRYAIDAY